MVTLPNFLRAASRPSENVMPRAMFSSVSISMWASISRARSASQSSRRKQRRSRR